jgi:hypothetical protein
LKRTAVRIPIDDVARQLGFSSEVRCQLYVDAQNRDEIESVFFDPANKKKLRRILYELFSNRYNDDLYRKEWQNTGDPRITAMKFTDSGNTRIYCREFHYSDGRKIVMLQAVSKKTQKNDNQIRARFRAYGEYEYEFE